MLLVILGAGASRDSVADANRIASPEVIWQPPLTKDLFREPNYLQLLTDLPAARGLAEEIRHALADTDRPTTLEDELSRAEEEAGRDPSRPRELVAMRFYLQSLIAKCSEDWVHSQAGLTNHVWLVRLVELWRASKTEPVLWVTFNYDTILDNALEGRFGVDLVERGDLGDYVAHDQFQLFKLHGSYNWVQRTSLQAIAATGRSPRQRDRLIDSAGTYSMDGPMRPLRRTRDARISNLVRHDLLDLVDPAPGGGGWCAIPSLAIPVKRKSAFACPADHIAALDSQLPSVDRVLTIGWRGVERPFLDRLRGIRSDARFVVVAGGASGAEDVVRNVRAAEVPGNFTVFAGKGFSGLRDDAAVLGRLLE